MMYIPKQECIPGTITRMMCVTSSSYDHFPEKVTVPLPNVFPFIQQTLGNLLKSKNCVRMHRLRMSCSQLYACVSDVRELF